MEQQLKTEVINYGNGIYAIDQQMVRAFLLVGERGALLLDTGAVRIDINAYISEITKLPLTVIITHGDGDHIGNLQDFPDAYVCRADMTAIKSHQGCDAVTLHELCDGQTFDIGGRKLSVIFTPGHTEGSVCLLDCENKILFSGDTVSYGPVFMFGQRRNMNEYRNSLQMLKAKKDGGVFDTVYCCHNTCPIPADTVDTLISCVDGIMNKTITGTRAAMPNQGGTQPLLGKYGECSILFT